MRHKVQYEIKKGKIIIHMEKTFDNVPAACTFFNEIKSQSYTKPIIETIYKEKK